MALNIHPFEPLTTRETSDGDALTVRGIRSLSNGINVHRQYMPHVLLNSISYANSTLFLTSTTTAVTSTILGFYPLIGYRNLLITGQWIKYSGVDGIWEFYAIPSRVMDLGNWETAYTTTNEEWGVGSVTVSSASVTRLTCNIDMTALNTSGIYIIVRVKSSASGSASYTQCNSLLIVENGCDQ